MNIDRRLMWLGGAFGVVGVALAAGVPLSTLLTLALVLACPASMFLMMRMGMGRTQGGAQVAGPPAASVAAREELRDGSARPAGTNPGALPLGNDAPARSTDEDPIMILNRRLAAGEITLEQYDRLLAVISAPAGTAQLTAGEGQRGARSP